MSLKLQIATNTFAQLVGKAVTAGCTFFITILIARAYGVDGFGNYTKIISYIALFWLAIDFGLNAYVLQQVKDDLNDESLSSLFYLRLFLAVFWIIVSLGIVSFLPSDPTSGQGFTSLVKLGIILLSPTIITQGIYATTNAYFQYHLRYDLSVMASSIGSIVTLLCVYLLTVLNASLTFIFLGYLGGSVVMAIIGLYLAGGMRFLKAPRFSTLTPLLWGALPLGITLIFNVIYFRADTFILTLYRPTSDVGIYGLAYRFFEFPLTLPTYLMNALYPILLRKRIENNGGLLKSSTNASIVLFFLSIVIVIVGFILAPFISIIDPSFDASIPVFRILLFSLPLFFVSSVCMWILVTLKKNILLTSIYGLAMFINISLNLIFIPTYGYMAAAIITGVSEAIILVATGYVSIRELRRGQITQ